jgi:hypothetical protein
VVGDDEGGHIPRVLAAPAVGDLERAPTGEEGADLSHQAPQVVGARRRDVEREVRCRDQKEYLPQPFPTNSIGRLSPVPVGTVSLVESARPEADVRFRFEGDVGTFRLTDDGRTPWANRRHFTVEPGLYVVRQVQTRGWRLRTISCADPDDGSEVVVANRRVRLDVDADETVTCTFVDRAPDVTTKRAARPPAQANR